MTSLLDQPATRARLQLLHRFGLLDEEARIAALRFALPALVWWTWASRLVLLLGTALIVAGGVYFFAYNWGELTKFDKLGLVEAGFLVCAVGAGRLGISRLGGKALLFAACVTVGVFLAVFGQIYQTGADAWELFLGWAALILPWVFLSRFAGLWMFWLLLVNLWAALYVHQMGIALGTYGQFVLIAAINAVALMVREAVANLTTPGMLGPRLRAPWLQGKWHRRLLVLVVLLALSIPSSVTVLELRWTDDSAIVGSLGMVATLIALTYYYIYRAPDLLVVGMGALTVCLLFLMWLGSWWFDGEKNAFAFLFFGLIVLGIFWGAVSLLRWVAAHLMPAGTDPSAEGHPPHELPPSPSSAPAPDSIDAHPSPSLRETLEHLQAKGLVTQTVQADALEILKQDQEHPRPPWFLQAMMGLGAWLSVSFFLSFMGILGLINDEAITLLIWGILLIAAGLKIRPDAAHTLRRQASLAISMSGKALFLGAFSEWFDWNPGLFMGAVLVTLVTYPLSKDMIDRFVMVLTTGILGLIWVLDRSTLPIFLHLLLIAEVVGLGAAFTVPSIPRALRPAGYALALLLLGTLLMPLFGDGSQERLLESMSSKTSFSAWPARIYLLAALIWLYQWAAGGIAHLKEEPLLVAVVVTGVLALVASPGILAALGVLVLGYGLSDRLLMTKALIFLPAFFVLFYYDLNTTLISKAWVMAGSGAALLAARAFLASRPWAKEAA